MSLKKRNTILFDLDGTLVDSIELIVFCFQNSLKTVANIDIPRDEVLARIGKPLRPQLKVISPQHYDDILECYRQLQYQYHDSMVKPFFMIPESIELLAKSGFTLGIVTSKGKDGTQAALNLMPSTIDHFKIIITADDSKTHKPDPGPLLQASQDLKVNPQDCYYVGDTIFDMQAALSANMIPVGVLCGVAKKDALSAYTDLIFDSVPSMRMDGPLFNS